MEIYSCKHIYAGTKTSIRVPCPRLSWACMNRRKNHHRPLHAWACYRAEITMKRSFILQFAIGNWLLPILLLIIGGTPAIAGDEFPAMGMIELTLSGHKLEGTPLAWNEDKVHLLARDGKLWEFRPEAAENFRQTADRFRSYSTSELRAELLRELGNDFEVSGTGHYLIVHPRGQRDLWAERFEELYRSFTRYFSVRGFRLTQPPFPLVGVVCKNQRDFRQLSASQGVNASRGVLGYYSQDTNRITMYDTGGSAKQWQENAAVIIHEATHQTAFNTGVHSRVCASAGMGRRRAGHVVRGPRRVRRRAL